MIHSQRIRLLVFAHALAAAGLTACGGSTNTPANPTPLAMASPVAAPLGTTSTPSTPLATASSDANPPATRSSGAEPLATTAAVAGSPRPAAQGSTAAPEEPSATPAKRLAKVYLIALNDDGKSGKAVGCGDSVVAVQVQTAGGVAVLKNALEALLSIKDQNYGPSGLYNALYQANLEVAKVTLVNGHADLRLSGRLVLGGTCDSPRVKAQIEETARQFSTVKSVSVYVNDVPLEELISATGE